MVFGCSSMQRLLAHQYMHYPSAPLPLEGPALATSVERTSHLQRRRQRWPFSVSTASALCDGECSSLLYSSVNHLTHRLPETLGVHYPVAPNFRRRNLCDAQLMQEAAASRRVLPMQSVVAASFSAHTMPLTSQQRRYTQAIPKKPSKGVANSYAYSLPHLWKRSSVSAAVQRRRLAHQSSLTGTCTAKSNQPAPFLQSATTRPQSSFLVTCDGSTSVSDTTPEPCMQCTVRWAACVVRDDVASDRMARLARFISTTSR
ncbi:hypothetical protein LSCM1_05068 [Leishmania martiniquensis]|uniref:Uncharacterized protein n=1 Tax=Leishmania martiniquensis TaxID=1580590 RepID=A0A836KP82_9TRYP|nr:hypothetical protein LSCM1_05068 [Leishmania martiniquensis]